MAMLSANSRLFHPTSCKIGTVSLSWEQICLGCGVDNPSHSSIEVKGGVDLCPL